MANSETPHGVYMTIQYEVDELTPHGEMNGRPVIAKKVWHYFSAPTLADTQRRLNEVLAQIKRTK